jgi:uncharacterized protein with NRDE domain
VLVSKLDSKRILFGKDLAKGSRVLIATPMNQLIGRQGLLAKISNMLLKKKWSQPATRLSGFLILF